MIKDFAILKILSTVWDVTEISETVVETQAYWGVFIWEAEDICKSLHLLSI